MCVCVMGRVAGRVGRCAHAKKWKCQTAPIHSDSSGHSDVIHTCSANLLCVEWGWSGCHTLDASHQSRTHPRLPLATDCKRAL